MPLAVDGGLTFRAIQTTRDFTCGLTSGGTAYCWGANSWGQLGRDTTATRTPVAVSGNHTFTTIAVGGNNACGIVAGGDLYCWGDNGSGLLGNGDSATGKNPVPVLIPGALHFKAVALSGGILCALTTAGVAYCWGSNSYGQLGDGTRSPSYRPGSVETNLAFSAVAAGAKHVCAVSDTGELYCWGFNDNAQLAQPSAGTALCLGGPTTFTPCALRPLPAAEGHIFRAVTTGLAQTCAIERNGGGAFCWGANDQGQLGIGSIKDTVVTPTRLADP